MDKSICSQRYWRQYDIILHTGDIMTYQCVPGIPTCSSVYKRDKKIFTQSIDLWTTVSWGGVSFWCLAILAQKLEQQSVLLW